MAGTEPIFGDLIDLSVGGVAITIGKSVDFKRTWKNLTAAATWGSSEVDKPVSYKDVMTIPFSDMVGNVDFDALWNMADGTAKAIVLKPEGTAAGKPVWSGNAYVAVDGFSLGLDKASEGTLTLSFTAAVAKTPNIVLSATALGTVACSGNANAYTTPVASGGTSTYALTIVRGILPEGVSMSTGGVFSGTVAATANVGTYLFEITVTDSAATPVVKVIPCSLIVTA